MAISILQRTKLCCISTVFLTYQGNIAELRLNCIQPINLCRQPMIDKKCSTSLLPLFHSNSEKEHILVKNDLHLVSNQTVRCPNLADRKLNSIRYCKMVPSATNQSLSDNLIAEKTITCLS